MYFMKVKNVCKLTMLEDSITNLCISDHVITQCCDLIYCCGWIGNDNLHQGVPLLKYNKIIINFTCDFLVLTYQLLALPSSPDGLTTTSHTCVRTKTHTHIYIHHVL